MTDWKWRLHLFVPVSANTSANRTAFAQAFVNNGSGESLEDEAKLFEAVTRLSTTGNTPAQAYGLSTLVKASMRSDLQALLATIGQSAWYVVASADLPQWSAGELIQSSRASVDAQIGTQFTFDDALADLGLQRIEAVV